jgi:hypothetical protein
MMAIVEPTLAEILSVAGYTKRPLGADVAWKMDVPEKGQAIRASIEILERKNQFHMSKCHIEMDLEKILKQIQAGAKRKFGKIASMSGQIEADGRIRSVMAIAPRKLSKSERSRAESGGAGTVIGWTTSLDVSNDSLSLQFTEAFAIGDTLDCWWANILSFVSDAVFPNAHKIWQVRNLQELSLPIMVLAIPNPGAVKAIGAGGTKLFSKIELPISLKKSLNHRRLVIEMTAAGSSAFSGASMEILEVRESAAVWHKLDLQISQRDSSGILPVPSSVGRAEILARIGAEPDLNIKGLNLRLSADREEASRASLLALTGAIVAAKTLGRDQELVHTLSDLLRKITDSYGPLNSLEPLACLAAEILGDYWANISPEMALKSWLASIQDGRDSPRVQQKIALLAHSSGMPEVEYTSLIFLAHYERRTANLELVANRLIGLGENEPKLIEDNSAEYLSALEQILKTLPNDAKVILALVKRWVAKLDNLRALNSIEACLSSSRAVLANADLAELNAAMAEIWYRHEGKTSLATSRYILATSDPAEPSQKIYSDAEQFFVETNNSEHLERILGRSMNGASPHDRGELFERSARHHIDKKNHKAALGDILRAVDAGRTRQWYLDAIEDAADQPNVDVAKITTALLEANLSDLSADAQVHWHLTAGQWALKSPETADRGLAIFKDPKVIALLSGDQAALIQNYLTGKKRTVELNQFLAVRILYAGVDETQRILELVVKEGLLHEGGMFENALAEGVVASGSIDLSLQRAQAFIHEGHVSDLRRLVHAHMSSLAGTSRLTSFLAGVREGVIESRNRKFEEILEEVIDDPMSMCAVSDDHVRDDARLFLLAGFTKLGERCLRLSIEQGHIDLEDEDLVSSILIDDPALLALWHFRALARMPKNEERTKRAATALKLWLSTDERPAEIIDLLIDSDLRTLDVASFELLESLCVREARLEVLVFAFSQKIMTLSGGEKKVYIHWCVRIIMSRLRDVKMAADYFESWTNEKGEDDIYRQFTLGYLRSRLDEDVGSSTKIFKGLLESVEMLNEPVLLLVVLEMFAANHPKKQVLEVIVATLIAGAKASHMTALVPLLVDFAVSHSVAGMGDLDRIFVAKFPIEGSETLAKVAIQVLVHAEGSSTGVQRTLAEWESIAAIAQNPEKWWDVVRILTKDESLGQLKRAARCDLLYLHAKNLFNSDRDRLSSIAKFEAIESENPLDSRTWIPLYSLYEENGKGTELIGHLARIIPLLERDPGILEKTPLTIESLKSSLRRARLANPVYQAKAIGFLEASVKSAATGVDQRSEVRAFKYSVAQQGPQFRMVVAGGREQDWRPEANADKGSHFQGAASSADLGGSSAFAISENALTHDSLAPQSSVLSLSSSSMSQRLVATGHNLTSHAMVDRLDWREVKFDQNHSKGVTERIMTMAFASELEKHIAIQYAAMMSGETKAIESWHWPVWKSFVPFEYSLSPASRMAGRGEPSSVGGPLHRLLRMVGPIIIRSRQEKFLIRSRLEQLGVRPGGRSVLADVSHPAISRAGLRFFVANIVAEKIKLYDTAGLGEEVFLDLKRREIHFDGTHQLTLPPGVLTHKTLEQFIHYRSGHFGLVALDAARDILPGLEAIKKVLSSSGISRLRLAFGMQDADIERQLKSMNRDQIVSLLAGAGSPSIAQIFELQFEMRSKSLTTILASTLDLIGLLESLVGRSLCEGEALAPNRILEISPYAKVLLTAAKKLNL